MRRGAPIAVAVVLALALPAVALGAADPRRGEQWGLTMIDADAAHSVTRGAGATVAVVDTGVRPTHEDLQGRLVAGHDFVGHDGDPSDENGHGTHVAGIVAANTGNGVGISSVAPAAKIMPIRVLDADGGGTSSDVAAGIDWAVDHGADVINLSLGEDAASIVGSSAEYTAAVGRALDAGRVVVAAAGNIGLPACDQPGTRGRLLCVGAVDRCGSRPLYSNFGNGLSVAAPGGGAVLCPDEILSTSGTGDTAYEMMSGTSQATPHVSGVAALVVARGYCGQRAAERILATATDKGPTGRDGDYGAGIVNANRAVSGLAQGPCRPAANGKPGSAGQRAGVRIAVKRSQRIRTALKRGIRVRCHGPKAGRCKAAARRKGRRRLALGSRRLKANRTATVTARFTKPGKAVLRRALKRRKKVKLTLTVRVPGGGAPLRRKVTLRP